MNAKTNQTQINLIGSSRQEPLTLKDQCYTAFTDFYGIDDKDETFDADMQKAIIEFNHLISECNKKYSEDGYANFAQLINDCLQITPYCINHEAQDGGKYNFLYLKKTGLEVSFEPEQLSCTSFDDFVSTLQKFLNEAEGSKTKYYCIQVKQTDAYRESDVYIDQDLLFESYEKAAKYLQENSIAELLENQNDDERADDGEDPNYLSFDNDTFYNFYITTLTF